VSGNAKRGHEIATTVLSRSACRSKGCADGVKPQVFEFGSAPWPDGLTVLQVYAPVMLRANSELAGLVIRWRAALHGAPLALVSDDQLHITLDVVADRPAGEVSAQERATLAAALQDRLTGWPCYHGSAGSALAYSSGAVVDISPAEPLVRLGREVRTVLQDVRGPASATWRQAKPHISLGYARELADSDPWQRALRQVDPNHAPLYLDEVHLVEVQANSATKELTWGSVAIIPLTDTQS
jgi:2'-5' RNA ligase